MELGVGSFTQIFRYWWIIKLEPAEGKESWRGVAMSKFRSVIFKMAWFRS